MPNDSGKPSGGKPGPKIIHMTDNTHFSIGLGVGGPKVSIKPNTFGGSRKPGQK
jgi:hypothetical protein